MTSVWCMFIYFLYYIYVSAAICVLSLSKINTDNNNLCVCCALLCTIDFVRTDKSIH